MEPELEFEMNLPARDSRLLLRSLHQQLRAAILDGRLQPGLRLPTTRAFAVAYGVSRNTAVAAYDLLLSEGYVLTRHRAGTYVADQLPHRTDHRPTADKPVVPGAAGDRRLNPYWRVLAAPIAAPSHLPLRHDFRVGIPETTAFAFDVWRRLSAKTLRILARSPATYAEPQGQPTLQEAIAGHVSFARAVACRPEDIIVTAGAQQAFNLLARILITPGRTVVAMEEPGYPPAAASFAAAGANIVPVPVDQDGLMVDRLPNDTRVILVTPSHQFPLGPVMSLPRRAALLEFAQKHGAVIIEDDYDGEFRFGARPLDALQTLDRTESVFYVGTFSKSMFPALRLGFIVTTPWAQRALVVAKQAADWHCSVATQETLAAFIAQGHLARHVRKMREIYAARRQALLSCLQSDFGHQLEPFPSAAGLHLAARMTSSVDADALVQRARQYGIGITSLSAFYAGTPDRHGLVFGYGAIAADAIVQGLAGLKRLM